MIEPELPPEDDSEADGTKTHKENPTQIKSNVHESLELVPITESENSIGDRYLTLNLHPKVVPAVLEGFFNIAM